MLRYSIYTFFCFIKIVKFKCVLIFGLLLRGKVLDIQKRCGLYMGATNTRVYMVINFYDEKEHCAMFQIIDVDQPLC